MPRIHTLRAELTTLDGGGPGVRGKMEKEEAGEVSIAERSRVLAQSRSLNEREVESQRGGGGGGRGSGEDTESDSIYSRSLKFRAVKNKERKRTRSRKIKEKNCKSYNCNDFNFGPSERGIFKGLPRPNHVREGNSPVAPPLKD